MTDHPATTARCAYCQLTKRGVRVVKFIEMASGPSASVYACEPCVTTFRLKPLDGVSKQR